MSIDNQYLYDQIPNFLGLRKNTIQGSHISWKEGGLSGNQITDSGDWGLADGGFDFTCAEVKIPKGHCHLDARDGESTRKIAQLQNSCGKGD